MKDIFMKNLLTFTTVSGKTQLRGYVKVALGVSVILVVLFGVNAHNRNQMVSEVMAAPRPLDANLMPNSTAQVVVPVAQVEECSSNPADWSLTENASVPGSNLKGLSPQCARDQLDRTAAWLYATSVFGYGRTEAAGLFGFSKIPMEYQFEKGGITVVTDFKDEPQIVELRFPSDNTGLKEWRIGANGQPAVEFTFSGCFRTSSVSGGEITSWGDGYPVVCQYFADFQTRHLISDANGKILTINGRQNLRRPMWFGYVGNGNWVFLGDAPDLDVDLSRISNRGSSTINSFVMAQEYNVSPRPLPENWATFTGQEFAEVFLEELDISE
jgi:hypothetical protein